MSVTIQARIRTSSTRLPSRDGNDGEMHITGLTKTEVERMKAVVHGQSWLRTTEDGRLEFQPTMNPLPGPADDEQLLPHWPPAVPRSDRKEVRTRRKLVQVDFDFNTDVNRFFHPSFSIQHLCGYSYTPENYKRQADLLESWGFECLRSRRGESGHFWEIWYLPDILLAQGELKKAVGDLRGVEATEKAINFLCRRAQFGTLDLSTQRAAMPAPD